MRPKKFFAVTLAVLSLTATIAVSGCKGCGDEVLPESDLGYFSFAVKVEDDGTRKAYITGLTDSGARQKVLVCPYSMGGGAKVYGLGYIRHFLVGSENMGRFHSDNLEKFFFPHMPLEVEREPGPTFAFEKARPVWWDTSDIESEFSISRAGAIYGYNYYRTKVAAGHYIEENSVIANVSFMYNYEGAENDGYFWVDSYDEDVITFIPPNPERPDYLFGGWYKEPECISRWDFERDRTGKELYIEEGSECDTYEGVYIYAKWISNT